MSGPFFSGRFDVFCPLDGSTSGRAAPAYCLLFLAKKKKKKAPKKCPHKFTAYASLTLTFIKLVSDSHQEDVAMRTHSSVTNVVLVLLILHSDSRQKSKQSLSGHQLCVLAPCCSTLIVTTK